MSKFSRVQLIINANREVEIAREFISRLSILDDRYDSALDQYHDAIERRKAAESAVRKNVH